MPVNTRAGAAAATNAGGAAAGTSGAAANNVGRDQGGQNPPGTQPQDQAALPRPPYNGPPVADRPRLAPPRLPKLTRTTFYEWYRKVKSVFQAYLWTSLLSPPQPGEVAPLPEVILQAKNVLTDSLVGSDQAVLDRSNTIWEAVDVLRTRCLGSLPVTRAQLSKAIWSYESKPGDTVMSIIENLRVLSDRLEAAGQKMTPNDLGSAGCNAIKAALPKLTTHVDHYMASARGDLSLEDLETMLQPVDDARPGAIAGAFVATQAPPESTPAPESSYAEDAVAGLSGQVADLSEQLAYVVGQLSRGARGGRGRRGRFGGNRGRYGGNRGRAPMKRQYNQSGPRSCFNCGKTDHVVRDCQSPCGNCGGIGHVRNVCPSPKVDRGRGRGQGGGKGAGRANAALPSSEWDRN
jgi:hypothetical protein